MHQVLDTGIKNAKNVLRYTYGAGSLESLSSILNDRRKTHDSYAIYFVDKYFSDQQNLIKVCPILPVDFLCFVDATSEPTTDSVNKLTNELVRNERAPWSNWLARCSVNACRWNNRTWFPMEP